MNTPIDSWRDLGTGIMVCVKMPLGGETVYMGAANKHVEASDLVAAANWLLALANGGSDGKHT